MARGSTRKMHSIPKYANTAGTVREWYVSEFEDFGWMILAKHKGYGYKIAAYKKSIENLLRTIDHLLGEYESEDSKHDLRVIRMHVVLLKESAAKYL